MNRLQKKCLIASTGLHALLALILLVGPAFLAPTRTSDATPLNFVPTIWVDSALQGGGNPNVKPPPAALPQPRVEPPAPPQPPEPVKNVVPAPKIEAPDPNALEPAKTHKVEVSTRLVQRKPTSSRSNPSDADNKARERELADARRSVLGAARSIKDGTGAATSLEDFGPGGGGPAYAGYEAWVLTVYENAWVVPEDATKDDAITKVSVTIARDGRVISSKIIQRSGDAAVDASVQRTLERVTTIGRPFPEGAKDNQRTYIIPFNLKVKRGLA